MKLPSTPSRGNSLERATRELLTEVQTNQVPKPTEATQTPRELLRERGAI